MATESPQPFTNAANPEESGPTPDRNAELGSSDNASERSSDAFTEVLAEQFGVPSRLVVLEKPRANLLGEPLKLLFENLEEKARSGDADASLVLAVGLARCASYALAGTTVEERINQLYATRSLAGVITGIENLDDNAELLRQEHRFCVDTDEEDLHAHFEFMLIAAESGDAFARARLTEVIGVPDSVREKLILQAWESKEHMNSDRFFHYWQAAESGSLEAIYQASFDPSLEPLDQLAHIVAAQYLSLLFHEEPRYIYEAVLKRYLESVPTYREQEFQDMVRKIIEADTCCYQFR